MKRRLRVLRSWLWIALLWSCTPGCGSTALPPNLLADSRAAVRKMAEPVREAAPRVNRIGDTLTELCKPATPDTAPVLSPDLCAQLEGDFNAVADAFGTVQAALPMVDAALAVIEAMQANQ